MKVLNGVIMALICTLVNNARGLFGFLSLKPLTTLAASDKLI